MVNPNSLIGRQIDQFRLDQYLAKGAMGMVFKAFDTVLVRTVALKLIDKNPEGDLSAQELAMSEEARKRLIQEAKAAGRLTHPNIVTIHAYGETEDFGYICMEYVPGRTLAELLKERKVLPTEEATAILEQVLLALEVSNKEKIVHRDIKPSNIMLTEDHRVKVMDFGIAKLPSFSMTVTGTVLGTPYYMSPEQIMGQKVDIRSDIFSLGALFYQMVTGEMPFQGESTSSLTYKIVNVEPVPPNVLNVHIPKSHANLIRKALNKDPSERYQTPSEMLQELRACGAGEKISETVVDDATIVAEKPASAEAPPPQEPTEQEQVVRPIPVPPKEEKKTKAEPVSIPSKETKPPGPAPIPEPELALTAPPPPRVAKSSPLKTFAVCILVIFFLGAGAIFALRAWHDRLRTATQPPLQAPAVQPYTTPDTQPVSRAPDATPQAPPTVQPPAQTAQQEVQPIQSVPKTTQQPVETTQQPAETEPQPVETKQQAKQQPPEPPRRVPQTIAPPPLAKTPPPPQTRDLKLDGGYLVKGVNPNGKTYKGTAIIERRGNRYLMTWNIANQMFSGSGTLSGNTLTINWSGGSGSGGVVIYKVERSGTLKGVWAKGKGSETLSPIR